jgi:hypothetical protein
MKPRFLNILTILALTGTALIWIALLVILFVPSSPGGLLPSPTFPPLLDIPADTATPFSLPPSWTPQPTSYQGYAATQQPSSTIAATDTPVVRSSFTVTPTWTNTPTVTRTITLTPTVTATPTLTATQNFTATELSRISTSISQTEAAQ